MKDEPKNPPANLQINVNLDTTPIYYTDSIYMTSNENGLTLDVMQKLGPTNQVRIVSRIGMSRQHAKKFAQELAKLLAMTEGRSQTSEAKN